MRTSRTAQPRTRHDAPGARARAPGIAPKPRPQRGALLSPKVPIITTLLTLMAASSSFPKCPTKPMSTVVMAEVER